MGLGWLPERPALAQPTAWPVGNTGVSRIVASGTQNYCLARYWNKSAPSPIVNQDHHSTSLLRIRQNSLTIFLIVVPAHILGFILINDTEWYCHTSCRYTLNESDPFLTSLLPNSWIFPIGMTEILFLAWYTKKQAFLIKIPKIVRFYLVSTLCFAKPVEK